MLTCLVAFFVGGYAFIVLVDPYDSVPYSIPAERAPVDNLQRFFHPALARQAKFDSAIIGTSNVRLLEPRRLNQAFGGNFVNLGIDAASAYEQSQIFNVFARHHPRAKTVIFGIDYTWCLDEFFVEFIPPRRAADFPVWLYDDVHYNNIPPYNLRALEHAWRQLTHIAGYQRYEYGGDGYTNFTDPIAEYDIAKARRNIYNADEPIAVVPVTPPVNVSAATVVAFDYPAITLLEEMLDKLDEDTLKIAVFVPYHYYFQARPGSFAAVKWRECKRRIAALFSDHRRSSVLDFMIESGITTRDENYWDYKHYTVEVAKKLADLIALGVLSNEAHPDFRRW